MLFWKRILECTLSDKGIADYYWSWDVFDSTPCCCRKGEGEGASCYPDLDLQTERGAREMFLTRAQETE